MDRSGTGRSACPIGSGAEDGDQIWLEFDSASMEPVGEHSRAIVTPVELTSMVTQVVTVRTLDLYVETYVLAPYGEFWRYSNEHVHSVVFSPDQNQNAQVNSIEACITGSTWTQTTSVDAVNDEGQSVVDSDQPITFVNGCAIIPTDIWLANASEDVIIEFNIDTSMAMFGDNVRMSVQSFTAVDENGIETVFSRPEEGLPAEGFPMYH